MQHEKKSIGVDGVGDLGTLNMVKWWLLEGVLRAGVDRCKLHRGVDPRKEHYIPYGAVLDGLNDTAPVPPQPQDVLPDAVLDARAAAAATPAVGRRARRKAKAKVAPAATASSSTSTSTYTSSSAAALWRIR